MNELILHSISLVVELITLGFLIRAQFSIMRLCRERDEAVKRLMLYMDQKTREINAHNGNGGRHNA
jgi:hypothetical protein